MKGFKKQAFYDNKNHLVDTLTLKSLPYGMWTTENNEEFIFNRDYEPIQGWNMKTKEAIPVHCNMWIEGILKQEYYYDQYNCPINNIHTFRECWDVLASWSDRIEE